ncbi:MAG TPA: NAD(P)H-binding protein, partial [Flavisolibacter sp.]|nr:NAD(P)H-binding protein [Flavisolibacter sp.]
MKKVLLFGSTGNLGRKIGAELRQQDYDVTAVVRNKEKANEVKDIAHRIVIADVTKTASLSGICDSFPIVISALGKSVSPNDKSKASFRQIDFEANLAILNEAIRSGVK